jgi:plastocyanin
VKPDTRDRLLLPLLLPLGILAAVALALWGFSRILLGVHGTPATAVALIVAATIVTVSALAAGRPQVRGSTIAAVLGGVAGMAMLAGGIAIAVVSEEEGEGPGPGPAATIQLVAANILFEQTALSVPAGQPFTIAFDNRDAGVQHNVQIFDTPDFSGTPLFDGELVTGPAQVDYQVPALAPGTYPFRCVVHPATMTGEIQAVEGGGGGGGGGGGVTVTAQNIAFDTDTIDLPADTASTITFDNRDAGVQHNISIYSDSSLGELLFKGDLVTGPATAQYSIPPEPAGEYYFQCDVHPTMNGSVIVSGGAGPAPGGTGATGPSP